uniref:RRM domain-containing protein n=1 Tax=Globodera pallida TaxID=36090 RepID=A0A183CLD0_GLOPA
MAMMTQVLHINNISPFATKEQIQMLFSYVGRIEEFKIYPSDLSMGQNSQQLRFAYIKFEDERGVEVGQHLTNTVFLDRALVCIPFPINTIPDEETAMQSGVTALPGQRQLPPHISNQLQDMGEGQQMIMTVDPNLAALGLPAYPPLPPTTEPTKVEEIRRTVYIGNLPKGCDGEELLNFFNACIGEVQIAPRAVPTSPRASVKRSSRSTSSSRSRRRRSRSTRSPSRSRRRRSKSPRERKRSRSRRRSRSRDKERKKNSKRSRSRERAAKESGKSSKRDRDNRSKERGEKEKNSKKDKEREKERDRDREAVKEKKERKRSRSREKKREKDEEKSSKKSKKSSLGETPETAKAHEGIGMTRCSDYELTP